MPYATGGSPERIPARLDSLFFASVLGSVSFFVDPPLGLIDPDPNTDPTPFFSDFKDAKTNNFFSYFFLITYPHAHCLQP
jgi:hypothetical protein